MKKFTSTLFLALVLTTAISTFAQAPGQIPIVGRAGAQAIKTTDSTTNTEIVPSTEIPLEISDYLRAIISVISQFKF